MKFNRNSSENCGTFRIYYIQLFKNWCKFFRDEPHQKDSIYDIGNNNARNADRETS